MSVHRHSCEGNANIRPRYTAESAAWIWHPRCLNQTAFLKFELSFTLEAARELVFHVSADQRFQLFCDEREVGFGPDRSDVDHWSFHTYRGWLGVGGHTLSALVWWIETPATGTRQVGSYDVTRSVMPPMAQMSFRGGFLFCAEDDSENFNSGVASWEVTNLTPAIHLARKAFPTYHAVGPSFGFDMSLWTGTDKTSACVVREPVFNHHTGVARPGWRLERTPLLEQRRREVSGGRIRALNPPGSVSSWDALIKGKSSIRLPADSWITILWDLNEYRCGYPYLVMSGGAGSEIAMEWAEALYEIADETQLAERSPKGDRDQIEGKLFFGFGDKWRISGENQLRLPSLWWRCGRYIRLQIRTAADPLVIEKLAILETGYPLNITGNFESSDEEINRVAGICTRTLKLGLHETQIDSPYYEQLSYVGDNLVQSLVSYVLSSDSSPARRSIQLFDWSRDGSGFVAERWPSALRQSSATYAMLWPQLVRNHAWWQDDADFVKARMPGIRCLLETLLPFLNADGSMGVLPGWSFVDWTNDWDCGYPPGHEKGDSALVTLHWIGFLSALRELESAFGEAGAVARCGMLIENAASALCRRHWNKRDGVFADDSSHQAYSEHANALAANLGLGGEDFARNWPRRLSSHKSVTKCSVYFLYFYLEALAAGSHADEFFEKLNLWKDFLKSGLSTVPEQPAPSRSDCHPWGSHPLYHFHASVAGIRPSAFGFQRVRVRPMLGSLSWVSGCMPHPSGEIRYHLYRNGKQISGEIYLPLGLEGEFLADGRSRALKSGCNILNL